MLIGAEALASVLKRIRCKGYRMRSKPRKLIYLAGLAVVGVASNINQTASLVAYSLVALYANMVLAVLCKERYKARDACPVCKCKARSLAYCLVLHCSSFSDEVA